MTAARPAVPVGPVLLGYSRYVPSPERDPGRGILPTLRELLQLPLMQASSPEIYAGAEQVGRPVRLVSVCSDSPEELIELDGALVLAATDVLPEARLFAQHVAGLVDSGVAALGLALGDSIPSPPKGLVRACADQRLPLVCFHSAVDLRQMGEALHLRILNGQYDALMASYEANARFTRISVEGGTPAQVLDELTRTTGFPSVFENMLHHATAFCSTTIPPERLLDNWEFRSREVTTHPGPSGPEGWLSAPVVAQEHMWGRVILVPNGRRSPNDLLTLEMAATALAVNRLLDGNRVSMEREAQRTILTDVISRRYSSLREIEARCVAVGVRVHDRSLVAVILDFSQSLELDDPMADQRADLVARYIRELGIPCLVRQEGGTRITVLLALQLDDRRDQRLESIARLLKERQPDWHFPNITISAGSAVRGLREFQRSFIEAEQVADAVQIINEAKPYYQLADIHLRGVLRLLRHDPRIQAFVERTLGPILDYDTRHKTALVETLRLYLMAGGNKSLSATDARKSHVKRSMPA